MLADRSGGWRCRRFGRQFWEAAARGCGTCNSTGVAPSRSLSFAGDRNRGSAAAISHGGGVSARARYRELAMACSTIARRLYAVPHAIISDNGSDTQSIIGEHLAPPGSLGAAM